MDKETVWRGNGADGVPPSAPSEGGARRESGGRDGVGTRSDETRTLRSLAKPAIHHIRPPGKIAVKNLRNRPYTDVSTPSGRST